MDSVLSCHIMLVAWIREVVDLDVVLHAFTYEAQTMLPYNNRVDSALTDEELALEILGLVDEAGLCISLRIGVRMIHITLSVHNLIPFPVDYRTSGHSHLEYIRVVGYQ